MQALTAEQQRDIVQAHQQGTEQRTLAAEYGVSRATISRVVSRAERRAVESLQAQTVGPQAIDPQTGASFEVADEDLLRSLARCLAHRSATVWSRISCAVADLGTVQALTSLAMAPKQRLNILPASRTCIDVVDRVGAGYIQQSRKYPR